MLVFKELAAADTTQMIEGFQRCYSEINLIEHSKVGIECLFPETRKIPRKIPFNAKTTTLPEKVQDFVDLKCPSFLAYIKDYL